MKNSLKIYRRAKPAPERYNGRILVPLLLALANLLLNIFFWFCFIFINLLKPYGQMAGFVAIPLLIFIVPADCLSTYFISRILDNIMIKCFNRLSDEDRFLIEKSSEPVWNEVSQQQEKIFAENKKSYYAFAMLPLVILKPLSTITDYFLRQGGFGENLPKYFHMAIISAIVIFFLIYIRKANNSPSDFSQHLFAELPVHHSFTHLGRTFGVVYVPDGKLVYRIKSPEIRTVTVFCVEKL